MKGLGIRCATITAYHPQSNGLVERMHRQLKAALTARAADLGWLDDLPLVLLGLWSSWREASDTSPAELVYGTSLRLLDQFPPGSEVGNTDSLDSFTEVFLGKMKKFSPRLPNTIQLRSAIFRPTF